MSDVLFLSHGGGPLPLIDEANHREMVKHLTQYAENKKPKAIIIFSAHYEANEVEIVIDHPKELLYDYYGFPKETYQYDYNPPVDIKMGQEVVDLIKEAGFHVNVQKRKFDHGVFVPLMIMFKDANIPVIQVSIMKGLDPKKHIELGNALSDLEDVLIIGSGSSYHNLSAYLSKDEDDIRKNEEFQDAMRELMISDMDESIREERLVSWEALPNARFVHPREEHLIPLMVCYGVKKQKGKLSFDGIIYGKRNICIEW